MTTKNVKRIIATTITLFAIYALLWGLFAVLEKQHIEAQNSPISENLAIPEGLAEWLRKLQWCESNYRPDAIGDGGKARGVFQFHLPTFKHYVQRYNLLPNAEAAEIENLWTDTEIQTRLVIEMIKENPENWRHWTNCTNKIGLPPT